MNRKPFIYGMIGLLVGSAATALAMVLTVRPFPQRLQAQPTPDAQSPAFGTPSAPEMWRMMGQPDQHFVIMMIPHHEGAIAVADLALERSQPPEIRDLAASIKETQSREIEQMGEWYQQWYDAEVPEWVPGMGMQGWTGDQPQWDQSQGRPNHWTPNMGMHGHQRWGDHRRGVDGGPGVVCMGMSTMMGDTTALQSAADFDRAFIEEMIPHHQMGVRMAEMVLWHSDRPELQALAQTIIDDQTAEINQMQQWYRDWYQ
jgi:uncharacterized protein (DUF305 family)